MGDYEHEYGLLAEAIIRQAIYDYQNALRYVQTAINKEHGRYERYIDTDQFDSCKLKNMPAAKDLLQERCAECERFFNSRWYATLINIPGKRFVDRINIGVSTGNLVRTKREFASGGD